jgi:uncharacterized protein (TIGR00106 family)
MIATVSFVPVGEGTSLSKYVARAVELIRASGLTHEFHAMGTNLEGDFDAILGLVKRCDEALFELGAKRVLIRLSLDDRRDKPASLASKRASVQSKLPSGQ